MPSAAPPRTTEHDVAIIGGGFFGCALALFFRSATKRVALFEAGPALMERASAVNQARVHSGLHYPRSFATARRSQRDFAPFVEAFRDCIQDDFRMLYAIARRRSQVRANRFETMFRNMGAPIERAGPAETALFDEDAIEAVFTCPEYAFDWKAIRRHMIARLDGHAVPVHLNTGVRAVVPLEGGGLELTLEDGSKTTAGTVFNVTYAQINAVLAGSGSHTLPLKHELAEIALIEPPPALAGLGVTVMDGPFFSAMPFPAEALYSLTHVRYTPHQAWTDTSGGPTAYDTFLAAEKHSRWRHMVQDSARYMPCLSEAAYQRSLYDVKTVLERNEADDGRPILLQEQADLPGLFSVLGGKVDNIFDLFEFLTQTRPDWADLTSDLVFEQ